MSDYKLPPIGPVPRFIVEEQRAKELLDVIGRYMTSEYPISTEWWDELKCLVINHNIRCRNLKFNNK